MTYFFLLSDCITLDVDLSGQWGKGFLRKKVLIACMSFNKTQLTFSRGTILQNSNSTSDCNVCVNLIDAFIAD